MKNAEKKRQWFLSKHKKTRLSKMYGIGREIRDMRRRGMSYSEIAVARGMAESAVREYANIS